MFAAFLEESWPLRELHLMLRCRALARVAPRGNLVSRQLVTTTPGEAGTAVPASRGGLARGGAGGAGTIRAGAVDDRRPVARAPVGRVSSLGSVTEEEFVDVRCCGRKGWGVGAEKVSHLGWGDILCLSCHLFVWRLPPEVVTWCQSAVCVHVCRVFVVRASHCP